MAEPDGPTEHSNREQRTRLPRRAFLGAGAVVGATYLAGCTSLSDDADPDQEPTPEDTPTPSGDTGRFRLLISDQPVAIDEFDSLTVWLDEARVFGQTDEDSTPAPSPTPDDPTPTPPGDDLTPTPIEPTPPDDDPTPDEATPTPPEDDPTPTPDEPTPTPDGETAGTAQSASQGYFTLDLDDASVDLTEVVGDKAIEVFDDELPAGEYTKIELYPSEVEGIVDGESVTVHIPSDRLQIVMPFEVVPGETVSFVFDINVVRRGNTGEYNLTPVIAKSGVIGRDIDDVDEIDPDNGEHDEDEEDGDESEGDDDDQEDDDGDETDDEDDGNGDDDDEADDDEDTGDSDEDDPTPTPDA